MNWTFARWVGGFLVPLLGGVVACSPTLDWREVRPAEAEVLLLFPCKPHPAVRRVRLGDRDVALTVTACRAGDATYALGHAMLPTPADATSALESLRQAALTHLGGQSQRLPMLSMRGMTSGSAAQRWVLRAERPGGGALIEHFVLFSRGSRVYQLTVLGERVDAEAVETFFAGLAAPV